MFHFHQGQQVFPLLEVGLQQQLQMLREDNNLKMTNIPCGNMSQERMGQAPRGREEAMCNGDETFATFLSKAHITV